MKRFCIVLCILGILHGSFSANGLSILKKWSFKINVNPHISQHFFANNKVYISSDDSIISCIDIITGDKLWEIDSCCSVLKVVAGKAYFLDFSPFPLILCVDENNGNILWKQRISDSKLLFADNSIYVVLQDLDDKYIICRYDLDGTLQAKYKNKNVAGCKIEKLDDNFLCIEQLTTDYYYENVYLDKNTLEFKGLANHLPEVTNLLDSAFIDKYCIVITRQSKTNYFLSLYDKKVETKFWSINIENGRLFSFNKIAGSYLYILIIDNDLHNKLYCIDIKSGRMVWTYSKKSLFDCLISNNHFNIIESDFFNSGLFLHKLDLKTGAILKESAFGNKLIKFGNDILDSKLYTYYKQNDKFCYEIIDVDTHEILSSVEIPFKSQLVDAFSNNLLIRDDFKREHILVNLETNQITPFENCSNYLFSTENQFLFYNYKDKSLECHVTTGDL